MAEKIHILDLKKSKLKEELQKPEDERNKKKIKRLRDSIKRHKFIAKIIKISRNKKRSR